jgi:hypothetical protein
MEHLWRLASVPFFPLFPHPGENKKSSREKGTKADKKLILLLK